MSAGQRLSSVRIIPVLVVLLLAACAPRGVERSRVEVEPPPAPEDRERLIVEELNELRTNPAEYATRIEQMLPYYSGDVLKSPGQQAIRTVEGRAAAEEAIAALRAAQPAPPLEVSSGLTTAARDHVRDIGPKGLMTHEGTGGMTSPSDRVARYASQWNYIGENISFGPDRPRDVITGLLIDDNVPDRGHRKILLDPRYRYVGVACGHHAVYRTMCVLDFAGEYRDRT
jgi:uncharacterized protein YkwD